MLTCDTIVSADKQVSVSVKNYYDKELSDTIMNADEQVRDSVKNYYGMELSETIMSADEQVRDSVKNYYGKELSGTGDLKTSACTVADKPMSKRIKGTLAEIHDEVISKYYGCGLVIPEKLEGMKVVDLGSGSGRDCFAVSKLVGQDGYVTGVDMTDEQLDVARKYIDYHREKFGFSQPNVTFVKGYIEKLTEAGIQENSQDIIISNCVVNLSPDKCAVISEAHKVLKVGGELYFSDVYADRDVPESARKHEVLWGECISGALWWKDLHRLAKEVGFSAPRLVTSNSIPIDRDDFKQVLGDAKFASVTYRLFKLPEKTEAGREVIYNGEITDLEKEFPFDYQFNFETGKNVKVDGELATILSCSRFKDEFDFQPAPKDCNPSSGCCKPKAQEKDPFELIEEKAKRGEKPASACCGPSQKKCC